VFPRARPCVRVCEDDGGVLQAIWRRARTAFLKYARERADELEDLYEEQRKEALAAVEAGVVVVAVDSDVNVPLKCQGDLAHYSIVG
jgi:hypothetical protein